ncbi:hypothetical protein ACK3TF_001623 [Chlorella vulgaris]
MNTPRPPGLDTGGKFASPAASIRSLSRLLEDDGHTPLASAFSSRPVSRPTTAARGAAEQQLQGMLASKESEAALLRQQLAQLTADFKFNLKLLDERDSELERVDTVTAGLREAAAAREAALQDARRTASDRDAALREKEARVAALEERQKQLVELCERQVADARASRDEEVARCRQDVVLAQSEAAKSKGDAIAAYERQLSAAAASEREARQQASAASDEAEHVRSALQRAEARIAEQELSMQRMVSQFEGALATLQQLEAQYDGLAADASAADAMRTARIADLEREVQGLRASRAALAQERDASVRQLTAAMEQAEAAAAEAKQQYHRAMMDAAEVTEAMAEVRQEAAQQHSRVQAAEEAAAEARAVAAAAQASLEREAGAAARAGGLLEAAQLHQEAARREAQQQGELVAQLRQQTAALEAESGDRAKAAEAAEARALEAEQRAQLLADQLEEQRQLHTQLLAGREAEVAAKWERALEAAHGERSTLQQALDLANRQLQAAHRDTETLRLQVQHLRLGAGLDSGPPPLAVPATAGDGTGNSWHASPAGRAGSTHSSGRRRGADGLGSVLPGDGFGRAGGSGQRAEDELEQSMAETASPAGSRDVFSELPAEHYSTPGSYGQQQGRQQQGRQPTAGNAYQQQLHRHIDGLAGKLSSFQRAVDEARLVGQQASAQLAESTNMLPANLQRRQEAAAAEQQLQQLAEERQQFEQEQRRLDRQLEQQQQLLREREDELLLLQRAEQARQQQQQQHQQHQLEEARQERQAFEAQQLQRRQLEADAAAAARPPAVASHGYSSRLPLMQPMQQPDQLPAMQLPTLGTGLSQGSFSSLLLPGRLAAAAPAPAQRRSVSAALAAVSSSGSLLAAPQGHQHGSSYDSSRLGAELPLPTNAGMTLPAVSGTGQAAAGGQQRPGSGGRAGECAGEDPLARARRQVLAAKQYLRSVAEMGDGTGGR